jgi:hypothetical protein
MLFGDRDPADGNVDLAAAPVILILVKNLPVLTNTAVFTNQLKFTDNTPIACRELFGA